jgi:TPP-dependent pyruvate/acetoin dehydrogenase alpha subunit
VKQKMATDVAEHKSLTKKKQQREPDDKALGLTNDDRLKLYYFMRLAREFDNGIIRLYRQGKIVGGAYTAVGNEATAVGSAFALEKQDILFPMHRDIGAHFVKGQTARVLMLNHLARKNSLTRGRDGTGHYYDGELNIYGNISHLGAMIPLACGAALASKMKKENRVVMNYIGEGGASIGDFHEALNFAAVMKLPFVLIIENNQFAYSTPTHKQYACEKLADRAIGYGIPGVTIDGTDVLEVYRVCQEAVNRARRGEGPTLIESVTMRMRGHAEHDDFSYVPKAMIEEWSKKDPIERFEQILFQKGILSEQIKNDLTAKAIGEISDAIEFAEQQPMPEGSEAAEGVYVA